MINKNSKSYRDKVDEYSGLKQITTNSKNIITINNLAFSDSRDCIGKQSLKDAQEYFIGQGGRYQASGRIASMTGDGISPIVVTFEDIIVNQLKNGDFINISDVIGNTRANAYHQITNVTGNKADLFGTTGNGNYLGGGNWVRRADQGLPVMHENSSYIQDNLMSINLNKRLKVVRSLSLIHSIIPRDIIPITTYLPDFVRTSTNLNIGISTCSVVETDYTTYIPQEEKLLNDRLLGFYSTPLDVFRTYLGAFALPDQVTPPPLTLWNPPVGVWPLQPLPYPYQTVPTYQSNNFAIPGETGTFNIILSGYGLYDLKDWTSTTGVAVFDEFITELARKTLLLSITPIQSNNGQDLITLILNSRLITPGAGAGADFGYGDFQRFVPGPGLGQNYQPGTSDGADPTSAGATWTVPFPDFRGNVWGPYDAPGDRFQKLGLRTLVQDLYLNGDLNNLQGVPIIRNDIATECLMNDPLFGLSFDNHDEVNLGNISLSTNPNILNSMRIISNGFGAVNIRARGSAAANYSNQFQSAGGQGPSSRGVPPTGGAWVDTGVYGASGTFIDPSAAGPEASLVGIVTPQDVDASYTGDGINIIENRVSWYDKGANSGDFIKLIRSYTEYLVIELPDTNLIITIRQATREIRVQSSNEHNGDAILSFPIRLNIGSSTGTIKYIEDLQPLLSNSETYWEKRYLNPIASMYRLDMEFKTYDGNKILLEKMLQPRNSLFLLGIINQIFNGTNIFEIFNNNSLLLSLLYDPLNPLLLNRMKRQLSFVFKIQTYEYEHPGLEINKISEMLESMADIEEGEYDDDKPFAIKASNYESYR